MKQTLIIRWLSALGIAAAVMVEAASAADVRVMISAGFYGVYSELGPAFERASGHRLVTTRGPSMGDSPEAIPTRLTRGEAADVVILDGGAAEELGKLGLVRADSKVELARSLIGMVVRAGAAKPDISSVETLRSTLLAAKSIAYSDSGSGTYLSTTLFPKLGIADESRARAERCEDLHPASGGRGGRARRGGNRLSTGERTDTRAWNYLHRRDSGRGPTGDFFRGGADRYGAAAASGECADPLPRIARGGACDRKGGAEAALRAIARTIGWIQEWTNFKRRPRNSRTCCDPRCKSSTVRSSMTSKSASFEQRPTSPIGMQRSSEESASSKTASRTLLKETVSSCSGNLDWPTERQRHGGAPPRLRTIQVRPKDLQLIFRSFAIANEVAE
jgi:hypothetical protein